MSERILFNSGTRGYSWLSNMFESPIRVNNQKPWPSVEHYYQAMKFTDPVVRERIREAPTGKMAKRFARTMQVRSDWDEAKVEVMKFAVKLKFQQNPVLAKSLKATGNAELIEDCPWEKDSFWGIGTEGGQNKMGEILMEIREILLHGDRK